MYGLRGFGGTKDGITCSKGAALLLQVSRQLVGTNIFHKTLSVFHPIRAFKNWKRGSGSTWVYDYARDHTCSTNCSNPDPRKDLESRCLNGGS